MTGSDKDKNVINYFDNILAMIPGRLYWKNIKGEYLGCNTLLAIDAGLSSREEIVGLTDYDMPWKEYADFLRKVDNQVISTGEGVVVEEKTTSLEGEVQIWLSHKEPLRDAKGEIIGIIGNSVDITDKKIAEKLELENRAYHTKEKMQEKFIKFIDLIQGAIESYRMEVLNEKIGSHIKY
ncbi:MAG: PAS domain-containing protein, partial [Neisseriaceae bacterium]